MSRVLAVGVVILIVLLATQSDLRGGNIPSFNSTSTVSRQVMQEKHRDGIKEKVRHHLLPRKSIVHAASPVYSFGNAMHVGIFIYRIMMDYTPLDCWKRPTSTILLSCSTIILLPVR